MAPMPSVRPPREGAREYPLPREAVELLAQAQAAERRGQRHAARERFNAALEHLDRTHHAAAAAAIMRRIGCTHLDERNLDAALDCFASAMAMSTAGGDRGGIASAYVLMAGVYVQRGELEHSELLTRRAFEADAELAVKELGRWVA